MASGDDQKNIIFYGNHGSTLPAELNRCSSSIKSAYF